MRPRHGAAIIPEPGKPRTKKQDRDMDEQTKELVAIGASVAANCYPCMKHHLAKCEDLGIPPAVKPAYSGGRN